MADALVSLVLDQLVSIGRKKVRLVLGVEIDVKKLETTFRLIQAVLKDAEEKQVKSEVVKVWLEELKDVLYDVDNVLDEWRTNIGMKKVRTNLFSRLLHDIKLVCNRGDIGHDIQEIRKRLDVIANEMNQFNFNSDERIQDEAEEPQRLTSSMVDLFEIRGRSHDKDVIKSKLLGGSSNQNEMGILPILTISIIGVGGMGKTTLAQLVFNDEHMNDHFEKTIWVCVSKPFDKIRVAKAILEEIDGNVPDAVEWQALHHCLSRRIKGKRFLLVLDDVWIEHSTCWDSLKLSLQGGAQGSRVVVTTRSEEVAVMMNSAYVHRLGRLSKDDSSSLFSRIAFAGRSEEEQKMLKEVGEEIVKKCKGVPFAVKSLGGVMRFKKRKEDWQTVLESETWVEESVFSTLLLSYYDLPPHLKLCFTCCAVYPEDYQMTKDKVIKLWMAHGLLNTGIRKSEQLEVIGEEYFDNLVMRSFFQELEDRGDSVRSYFELMGGKYQKITYYKIHDLVYELAQFITKGKCSSMMISGNNADLDCSNVHHLHVTCKFGTTSFPPPNFNTKSLRSLQLEWPSISTLIPKSMHIFKKLRALDMSNSSLEELPTEIEILIHIRLLDLSGTRLKALPKAVCNLYNLQTLNLARCGSLGKLPKGMGKLINLRHLEIDKTRSLRNMPIGIGRLSSLRTLSKFILDNESSGYAKVEELKGLNQLRGNLVLSGLMNIPSMKSAFEAQLKNKQYLCGLELDFGHHIGPFEDVGEEGIDRVEGILEGLQPHPSLEHLIIQGYRGSKIPSWMESNSISDTLQCLQVLEINSCQNLKALHRQSFPDTLRDLTLSDCPELSWTIVCLPPLLEKLSLRGDVGVFSRSLPIQCHHANHNKLKHLIVFGSNLSSLPGGLRQLTMLQQLTIACCPSIKCVPEEIKHLTTLQHLKINSCPLLESCYRGQVHSIISHIPKITFGDGISIHDFWLEYIS